MSNPYDVPVLLDIADEIIKCHNHVDSELTRIIARNKGKAIEVEQGLEGLYQADISLMRALRAITKSINEVVKQL